MLDPCTDRVANYPSVLARAEEIRAQNEAECRWGRKELLDFYCDVLERGAGKLTPDDRLCQGVEETTVRQCDSKGRVKRTITKRRLIMPSKVDCADGIRKMLGWDKSVKAGEPDDDITELLVMIGALAMASLAPLNQQRSSPYQKRPKAGKCSRHCLVSI